MIFADRADAGRRLAAALGRFRGKADICVVALPRGGVVLGRAVADALGAPLDIVVPRKIGAPSNPEFAIGAVTEQGAPLWNEAERARFDQGILARLVAEEQAEAARRLATYRRGLPPRSIAGKTVLLVDDGLATGLTMRAAIRTVRAFRPAAIVVAVPVAPPDAVAAVAAEADDVIVLATPKFFGAVGAFYEHFPPVEDAEVVELLKPSPRAVRRRAAAAAFLSLVLVAGLTGTAVAASPEWIRVELAPLGVAPLVHRWLPGALQQLFTRAVPPGARPGTRYTVAATAYSSEPRQSDSTPHVTASGECVGPGIIATNILPLGTCVRASLGRNGKVFGEYLVADRTHPRYKVMDIWMPTRAEALAWGAVSGVVVEVLDACPARFAAQSARIRGLRPRTFLPHEARFSAPSFWERIQGLLRARVFRSEADCRREVQRAVAAPS